MRQTISKRNPDHAPWRVATRDGLVSIAPEDDVAQRPRSPASDAHHLALVLQEVLHEGAPAITVDVSGLLDIDTSLVAVLIDARRRTRRAGAEFVVRGTPALRRMVQICGVDGVLALV